MSKKPIATLIYASGWKLTFPCHGMSPRLFLEWLGEFQHKHRKDVHPLTYYISREALDESEIDSDVFVIRFAVIKKEDARECLDYINSNQ